MNRQEQTNIINDLATFVKDHREDQFDDHESFYYELLKQWRELSRFSMDGADPASRDLYDRYWAAMGQWHQRFVAEQDRIVNPTPMPGPTLQEEYEALIAELVDEIIGDLPRPVSAAVIRIDDFARRLNLQLQEMVDLYTDVLTPIDLLLLVEYWRMVDQAVQAKEGDE